MHVCIQTTEHDRLWMDSHPECVTKTCHRIDYTRALWVLNKDIYVWAGFYNRDWQTLIYMRSVSEKFLVGPNFKSEYFSD